MTKDNAPAAPVTSIAPSVEDPQTLPTTPSAGFSLAPRSFGEAMEIAAQVAKSDLVPKDYQGKPANVLIAMQMGMELGLPPLQALQNIAVVNGRPAIWGDLLPALARSCPGFEYLIEDLDEGSMVATCRGKRKNQPEQSRSFSQADAQVAGLWGKQGPWSQYPKRMLAMRARSWLIRDLFPDALRGLAVREEVIDLDDADYSEVAPAAPPSGKPPVTAPRSKSKGAKDKPAPAAESEPPAPASAPAADGEAPADPKPLTDGMVRTAGKKLEAIGLPESALFHAFGVDDWSGIDRSQINAVLDWIKDQTS